MLDLWLFHKPYGVLSQFKPSGEKRTLQDFPQLRGGKAVGRLDEDSEGLLLVVGPGLSWLQHRLTFPGRVEKIYWAQVERLPAPEALQAWSNGVAVGDWTSAPARARLIEEPPFPPRQPPIRHRLTVPTAWLELALREGKNRQVRRMTAALGHPTLRLVRVAVGGLQLGALAAGSCRRPNSSEQNWLQQL